MAKVHEIRVHEQNKQQHKKGGKYGNEIEFGVFKKNPESSIEA